MDTINIKTQTLLICKFEYSKLLKGRLTVNCLIVGPAISLIIFSMKIKIPILAIKGIYAG
jgi:hypothetical protein